MSFQPSITLNGIQEAVHGLGYRNESALKYRLVAAIRERYGTNGEFSEPAQGIEPEELIRHLWDVDPDPDSLRSKKKNLSSIKSSVNADFKRLYQEGKNPEGITIGPENLFTISDEAKDDLLASIRTGGAATLQEIRKVAGILSGILSEEALARESHKEEMGAGLQQIGNLLKSLSEKMGLDKDAGSMPAGIEQALKGSDAEEGAGKSETSESAEVLEELEAAEVLEELEGEFPEADLDDLATDEDQPLDYEDIVIDDAADLTEVSEGEVFETIEEVEEDESVEEIDDSEISEEDIEFYEPEVFAEGEGEMEGSADILGAADTAEGLEKEGAGEDLEEALEVEEDLGELEEEETAEEFDDGEDTVFDASIGEGTPLEAEEEGVEGAIENAPVQGMSVGDEAGGTEVAGEEKARVLAERFNSSLSEMDRFYNQYLFVPAGEYTIGSGDPREKGNPAKRVRITEFYIGKFPVTNALFDVFVEKTGYRTTAERVGYGIVYYGRLQRKQDPKTGRETVTWNSSLTSKMVQGAFWFQPSGPGSNLHHKRNHPVVQVSLEDAMAFAAWTGKRLPSEEEWEAASRTIKGTLYPWGNRSRKDACNLEQSGHGDTTPVDRYVKFENEYGIADTLGNVLEWTTGKSDTQENEQGTVSFIAKGGSWVISKPVTLAIRTEFGPDFHSNILGFRCVAY